EMTAPWSLRPRGCHPHLLHPRRRYQAGCTQRAQRTPSAHLRPWLSLSRLFVISPSIVSFPRRIAYLMHEDSRNISEVLVHCNPSFAVQNSVCCGILWLV